MPRSSEITVAAILDASFRLFFKKGFARVSMDDIAAEAGVTKRTLYYHFPSKDALVGAALDKQNALSIAAFQGWSAPDDVTAQEFVAQLFQKLATWACSDGWTGSGFTRLSMELGDLPGHPARGAAQRHKQALDQWLTSELGQRGIARPEVIAPQILIILEGAMALSVIHADPCYFARASEMVHQIVEPD